MEVQYKRNFNESYLILEGEGRECAYEEQMMEKNQITSLLSFYTMEVNNRVQFWYDITGKESLKDYIQRGEWSIEKLEEIVRYMDGAYRELQKYLVKQEHILLCPETIFLERKEGELCMFLCYYPGELDSIFVQFREVMEFILSMADGRQKEITEICYRLYDIAIREHYSFWQLLDCIQSYRMELAEDQWKTKDQASYKEIRDKEQVEKNPKESVDSDVPSADTGRACDMQEGGSMMREKVQNLAALLKNRAQKGCEEIFQMIRGSQDATGDQGVDFMYDYEMEDGDLALQRPVSSGKSARLEYQGNGRESDYLMDQDQMRVGRDRKENEVVLQSALVERCHAKIYGTAEGYFLEDLGSRHGTFLNYARLPAHQKVPLQSMDVIRFADVEYLFVLP